MQNASVRALRASLESLESRLVLSLAAPAELNADLHATNAARLEWQDVSGETGYLVERRVDGTTEAWRVIGDTAENVTLFFNDGLTPGRTYLYRVRARDASGTSDPSNVDHVTVPPVERPDAPRELVAELVQGQFVRLRWADVSNERGYRIERRIDGSGSGDWVEIGNTAANVITFADERVEQGRTYLYRVRAFNVGGLSGYSNIAFVTIDREPGVPDAPRELNADLTDALRVRITWQDVADETGYKVERRIDGTRDWVQIGTTGQNLATFVDERVERGRTYIYRVRAFNDAGHSSYSNTDHVTVPGEPAAPAAPRLEVDVVGPRAARLHWTDVANETGYRIERRLDGSDQPFREIRAVNGGVTTITDEGLEAGRTYVYRVRAFNAAGNSPYSNTAAARLPAAGTAPAAPRELDATLTDGGRVRLRWVDVSGEHGYRIERRLDGSGSGDWVQIGTTGANVTAFVDERVDRGRTYVYRVRAFNAFGNSPYSNTDAVRIPDGPLVPHAPRLEADRVALRAVRLAWTNVANETGYRIYRRVDGSAEGFELIRTVGANVTTFTDEGREVGRTYLYKVRAFNSVGQSGFSNVRAVTIAEHLRPAAPRDLRAAAVSPTRVDLRWVGVEGETGYRVERRLDGTDAWAKIGFVGADVTAFSDTKAQPGRTYFYRVRSAGPDDSSAWSNVARATTPVAPPAGAGSVFSSTQIRPLDLESE